MRGYDSFACFLACLLTYLPYQSSPFVYCASSCFLVTFYFTQKLLPPTSRLNGLHMNGSKCNVTEALTFIKVYGSYLKLHTCIAYASAIKAQEVVDVLLEVAKNDPRHKEVMRQLSKANALIFYEPVSRMMRSGIK
jgi:hypothetical protein